MKDYIFDIVLAYVVITLIGALYVYKRADNDGYARTLVVGQNDYDFHVIFMFAWALLIVDVVWFLLCWPSKMWNSAQNSRWKTAHFFGL